MNPSDITNDNAAAGYQNEVKRARDDGTALPERTDDRPPSDLFHAAQYLAQTLSEQEGGAEAASDLNLALDAPALWGVLDVERAAELVRERFGALWPALTQKFPWLVRAAEAGEDTAIGVLVSQF